MKLGPTPRTDSGAHPELWLMVGMLLVASFLRLQAPQTVPPGPSHDELRMMDLGELIVEGERPIHWKISYSAEPLFMYLLALAMPVWGFTPFGARLVTRFTGLLLIPVVHRMTRRLFGRHVALFASGVLAVTWWPIFFSRVALRGITLPLVFTMAIIHLWRGLNVGEHASGREKRSARWPWLVSGAALVGLTWYTFTAARGLVLLLPILLVYLGALDKVPLHRLWRVALVTLGTATMVAAPFIYDMQVHPGVPETRLDQLGGIIDQLLAGNILPFVKQAARSMGLFAVTGDPNWRYNVAGRPVFGPVLGLLSVLGLVISVLRWRQPRYFILITWLLLGLAPSMLTPEAPSFVRGIGALPVVTIVPAIGAQALRQWLMSRMGRIVHWLSSLVMVSLLAVNGVETCRSLFYTWPIQPQVREIYQAALTEAFRDLNHSNLEGNIWISEPFPDDRHLLLAKRVLHRDVLSPRWFNANRAMVLPPPDGQHRYLLADFVEPHQRLFDRWMSDAVVILEASSPSSGRSTYEVYEAIGGAWVEEELSDIAAQSTSTLDPHGVHPVSLPARFAEMATLLGYELADTRLGDGASVDLIAYWRVHGPVFEPVASFVHLIDEQGGVVGQYDGFDVPAWSWEPGAVVAQVYRFSIDNEAPPGRYWLQIGLYNVQTMERIAIVDELNEALGTRLVLGTVMLE